MCSVVGHSALRTCTSCCQAPVPSVFTERGRRDVGRGVREGESEEGRMCKRVRVVCGEKINYVGGEILR